jgi:hypothetical protein
MSDIAQGKESGSSGIDFQTTSHSEHFNLNELSDLIRDFNLSKESSELLFCRLKEKNVLHSGMKITFYRRREKDFLPLGKKRLVSEGIMVVGGQNVINKPLVAQERIVLPPLHKD